MKSVCLYILTEHEGIYEIVRIDDSANCVVVQTNIRTHEKAVEARKTWQRRELEKHE
jgi:predicted nucleotide-binding protein (sugar kinase/HSP70/actin superfamily)